jgi:hypothetical protein
MMNYLIPTTLILFLLVAEAGATVKWDSQKGVATVKNGDLELIVETKNGLNPSALRNVRNGQVYADRDYSWPGDERPRLVGQPVVGEDSIKFKAKLNDLLIEQAYELSKKEKSVIYERITVTNPTSKTVATAAFKCGFVKAIDSGDAKDLVVCPVPYRRETNGQMQEFTLEHIASTTSGYSGWAEPFHPTSAWGAEGWVWTKGQSTFLLTKYNTNSMEWSLLEPLKRGEETQLRFAGAGQWKHGSPEKSNALAPGKSYTFGETRMQAIEGDWKQAYYAYRQYTSLKGCQIPKTYNPPIQWNELYDNEFYFRVCDAFGTYFAPGGPGFYSDLNKKSRDLANQYYSLDIIKGEAAKAKEIGCEALYLDPGWDVGGPELHVWDEVRLGAMKSFVKMLHDQYGLGKVSLWCSLAGMPPTIGDPTGSPFAARVMDEKGNPADILVCIPSPAFLKLKTQRLQDLCENGAGFLMFDSNQYTGPCYSKIHGHSIPSTREEHANALIQLAQNVRNKYPSTYIEMHDPVTGPSNIHYTPTYYGYDRKNSFTELWGHEFMWGPMDDVLSRRAISLYYFNLAYNIPLYLHVNLKSDNENALMFWWFASTVRHLGVGGKAGGPVWEAQKKAMAQYKPLKRFYTRGVFYGLDEMVLVHTLPDLKASVINVFNLEDKPVTRSVKFKLSEIGLQNRPVRVEGAQAKQTKDEVEFEITVPARGHRMVEVN